MQMNALQTITQRLLLRGLLCSSGPAIFSQATAPRAPIQSYLQPLVDNHTIAGAVILVATRDHAAYLSKPITAAALMLLVDEGKVNLDDPVEKYLPEFTGQMVYRPRPAPSQTAPASMKPSDLVPADHPILVREILSHTSGPPYIAPFLQRYVRLHLKLSRPSPSS